MKQMIDDNTWNYQFYLNLEALEVQSTNVATAISKRHDFMG